MFVLDFGYTTLQDTVMNSEMKSEGSLKSALFCAESLALHRFDPNVDAVERTKHKSRDNLRFLGGVFNQLIPPQGLGHHYFHLIHGKVLSNAVPMARINKRNSNENNVRCRQ